MWSTPCARRLVVDGLGDRQRVRRGVVLDEERSHAARRLGRDARVAPATLRAGDEIDAGAGQRIGDVEAALAGVRHCAFDVVGAERDRERPDLRCDSIVRFQSESASASGSGASSSM